MSEDSAWKQGATGGTVLRGKDGSLYFIRDELLDVFRVQGEGLDRLEEALEKRDPKQVNHFDLKAESSQSIKTKPVGYVRGSFLREDARNMEVKFPDKERMVASTVMCPWFC